MALFTSCNPILLFALFLSLVPNSAFAQNNNGNVTVGTSLTAAENSSPWLSPSGDFAFGFRLLPEQTDLFLLCIWYDKIPDKTIVWYANDDPQPLAPTGSKVNLIYDRGLVLTNPQGQELWKSESIAGDVDQGVMSDQGNFLLQDRSSETLWETFKYPTDTILPSQVIERGGMLSSRRSETNFTRGRFQLRLKEDGNFVLNTINLPTDFANRAYYESRTDDGTNSSAAGMQLVFNESSGSIYVRRKNGEILSLAPGDVVSQRNYYIRATLNFDGVFTQEYHPKNGSGSWTYLWSIPEDICHDINVESGAGVCGYNSICNLRQNERRPRCNCPGNYSLIDPNDEYGDCKPDFIHGCEEDELVRSKGVDVADLYEIREVINTDWPTSDYVILKPFTGDLCKESCRSDCLCAVAIFRDGTCWKKKLPLSNGRVDTSLNSRGFIKVRKQEYSILPNGSDQGLVREVKEKDQDTLILVGSVLFGTSVFVNILLASAVCIGFFFIYRKKKENTRIPQNISEMNLRRFTYKELVEATDGFKEELGSGAFGIVYKGTIQTGSSIVVAVKKLHFVAQDSEKEFRNEVNVIAQTHHKNLVRMLGYCDDGQNRLLVYEYLSNGTLANFVFSDIKPSWKERAQFALGIAKGLLYLHDECSTQIIHCDIKPQNILLDEYNNPKISDFGLAKLMMINQSKTHTAIRGTKGYVAPEWFRNVPVTAKVDVYSFGVVLLEIICCRKSVNSETSEEGKAILTDWAYDCFVEGSLNALVNWEVEALDDIKKLETYLKVSMWCIQENPSFRPTMRIVLQMLDGVVEVPDPPCPFPAYSITN